MLDASQRLNVLRLLLDLKEKRNLTVILITHDLASANVASDRTMIMYRGKLAETGPTESVLSRPHHPYTELILNSMPDLESGVHGKDVTTTPVEEELDVRAGCIFRPRCSYATEICATVDPELLEKSKEHWSACHNPLNIR